MMRKITVICDRCHRRISGLYDPETETTGGFYRVGGNSSWGKYRNAGEKNICDKCMFNDRRYQAVYGTAAAKAIPIKQP